MNKRILAALLCLCLLLSGCQLAKPEAQQAKQKDPLVGVFVTTEHIDLYDMDAFLQENAQQLLSGGEISLADPTVTSQRLYAEEREDGFAFTQYEGMLLACYQVQDENGNSFSRTVSDDGLLFISTKLHSKDDGSDTALEASIFLPRGSSECFFHMNPVYQDQDGRLYTVPATHGAYHTEFGSCNLRLNESIQRTENGVTHTFSTEVSITIDTADLPERIRIIAMSGENIVLDSSEYSANTMPEGYTPAAGTAYLLVEEYTVQGVVRKLYQPDSSSIEVFQVMSNGLCTMHTTAIHWPE